MKLSNDALKIIRNQAKLSQEEMADRMNILQSKYNRLETGKTAIKHEDIPVIAKAVGKNYEEILGQLAGCTINNSINDTAQNNQNTVINVVEKTPNDDKDIIIETQKQAISALNITLTPHDTNTYPSQKKTPSHKMLHV
jgi:transcriptional regulator with XRE-family HTH domain